jgi:hypothetical protein
MPPVGATPVPSGLIARAVGAYRVLTGKAGTTSPWFGAGDPLPALAPETAGRAYDYPTLVNVNIQPRDGERIGFAQLRGLAEGSDLVRLAIETRKDQMESLQWTVRHKESGEEDDKAIALKELLLFPDLEHEWSTWMRMLLEDLLVIDAPTLYLRKTVGGAHYALEVVDGATIKRVLDDSGRTPMPPDPAYQQILKGLPASDFTREELIYLPRNPRSMRAYGFSPVEQIIITVNTAIRRALHQLDYYTEGSIPEALASTPATWSPAQITLFQNQWDALMVGTQNSAMRRKIKFIPDGVKYIPTQTEKLFDEADEWLARVVCYAFSLPPNAFVKQQNRATAVSAQEVAQSEGLAPLMQWEKRLLNRVISGPLGSPDYEFTFDVAKELDGLTQAQIDHIYVTDGVLTVNEVRDALNLEPLSDEELEANKPAPPTPFGQPAPAAAGAPDPAAPVDPSAPQPPAPAAPSEPAAPATPEKVAGLVETPAMRKARQGRRAGRSLRSY